MKSRVLFALLLCAATYLAGCSAILPTPTPTPTATPVPTLTPLPTVTSLPTATQPKPTAASANALPPSIAFALNKTQGAHALKFEFDSSITTVQDGQTKDIPGLALKGYDSTLNRQVTISGTTSDTHQLITYELVVLGADVYIKGLGDNGLNAAQWYQLPDQVQAGVRRLPTARGLIASFAPEEMGKAQFTSAGTETLDELQCSVWTAGNGDSAQTLIGVTPDSDLKKQLGVIDNTEFKVWTCADGYIHLLTGSVQGHSAQNQANTAKVILKFQLNNFEQAVDIQAPKDAIPFPAQPPQTSPAGSPTTDTTSAPKATGTATATTTPTP